MTILPFPPWRPDLDVINGEHTKVASNVLPRADGYGPWKGPNTFSAPLAAGNDNFTKVLLHFDGANASTSIVDSNAGGAAHAWSVAGNAQISTAQSKFGFAASLYDGAGDWVTTPDSADFTLGAGNFSIDCWVRPAANGVLYYIVGQADPTQAAALSAWVLRRTAGNFLELLISNGSAFTTITGATTQITAGAWWHVAAVRNGNTITLYVNGAVEASVGFAAVVFDSANNLRVGAGGEVASNSWNGWIDEFRLSVGVARWTAPFVPPGKAYDASACRGYFYARKTDGSIAVFAATANRLFTLRATDLDWSDISGSDYAPLPTSYHWQFAQFGNLVIAVQPNVAPQVFDLSSSSAFAALGGAPPQAAYVSIVNRFVVLSGLTSNPFRIQWSGLGAATTWTPGVNSSDLQDFPDGGVVRGAAGGEYGVIFQDSVIRRMIYQPGDPRVFIIEKVTEDKGLLAPYSVVKAGTQILFLAQQGFHAMAATGVPAPIGKEKFDRYFFANYDAAAPQLVIGASDPEAPRCYFAFKSQGGPSGAFDRIICYDYALDRASLCSAVAGEYLASLSAPGLTLEGLDTISTSIDALTFSLDDVALSALPKMSIINAANHALSFFSGTALEATVDTAEQELEAGRRVRVRGFRPLTDAATVFGSIGARETTQAAASYSDEQPLTGSGRCPANVSTRLARARLRIPAATTWTFANGVEPYFKPEGLR
jgi:concanavalin A-like lectin/glucanase superfamily protein